MSCPFYTWKYCNYFCMKKKENIPEDIYGSYCRNYDYGDCPIYKYREK